MGRKMLSEIAESPVRRIRHGFPGDCAKGGVFTAGCEYMTFGIA